MRSAMGSAPDAGLLSFNQMTCDPANLSQAIEASVRGGLNWIGVWRHKIKDAPVEEYGRKIRDAGLPPNRTRKAAEAAKSQVAAD